MAGIFLKQVDVSGGDLAYRVEREKARQMTEVFASEEDLMTPALVDADDEKGLLTFESMPPILPFSSSTPTVWFERAGRALALVHSRLRLSGDLDVTRTRDVECSGLVFVHGDFMPNNLGVAEDRLVVFDWGLRPWTAEFYTKATPALDLAGFLGPWMLPRWWDSKLPLTKLSAMVRTYLALVEAPVESRARTTLLSEVADQYDHRLGEIRRRKSWKRPLGLGRVKLNRWRLERALAKYIIREG